ncbi:MAG: hypothetical protein PHE49_06310 [bacterium]|nr:hypothetical protein [bacterium]
MRRVFGGILSMLIIFFIPALMIFGTIFFIFSGSRTRFEIG